MKPPFTVTRYEHFVLVRFAVDQLIESHVIERIGQQLSNLVNVGDNRLVLDFSQVGPCSSAMLGKLIGLRKLIRKHDGRLVLCGINEPMADGLRITGLRVLFEIVASVDDAKATMKADAVAWNQEGQ